MKPDFQPEQSEGVRNISQGANSAIQANTVTIYENLSVLPDAYERLFSRAGKLSLFHTLPWYQNFIRTVLGDKRLRIYAVEDACGKPRAVLMMRHPAYKAWSLAAKRLDGLANYYSSLFGPIIDPEEPDVSGSLAAVAEAVARDSGTWDVVDLHPLAVDDQVFQQLIDAFQKAGFLVERYFCFGNWYLPLNGQSFAAYIESRPSQVSKTGQRRRRKLERSGRFRFQLYASTAGLETGLADYNAVYGSSWKIPEPYPDFIGGLLRTCAERGWLRLGVGYVDGQPAAAQIWMVVEGTASIFKLAYDERFAKEGVGTVVSSLLMEHAIDVDKVETVDYLTGDDAYKRDWMSHRRERWGIVAFNPRTPHGLLAAGRHHAGKMANRILRRR